MEYKSNRVWLAACLWASILPVHAQDGVTDMNVGGARSRLSVKAVAFYTDNFYNGANGNETDTIGGIVTPEYNLLAQTSKLNFATTLGAEFGAFDLPGSEDDYLDGSISAKLGVQASARSGFRLSGGFKAGHDPFGVDRTEDATVRDTELDKWNRTSASLHYRYGAPGAKVNAEVGVSGYDKKYTTNEAATSFLDHDATTVEYKLFYNYSPKTTALLDFSRTDFGFDRAFGGVDTRSGELYRARVGLRWLATGKTSGDVRVGYRRRAFEEGPGDVESADWAIGIDWSPIPRSTVRLESGYSEQPSYTALARVIDIEATSLAWKYNITARTRSTVQAEHITASFSGSPRDDTIYGASVGLEHLVARYLWVVGNVGTTVRDSTVVAREYDRINAFFGVRLGR